jgi:hypothetical protein
MTTPLFYQRIVSLDSKKHSKLRLRRMDNLAFAADSPLIPLLATEFIQAAREYPIVFVRGADQTLLPVALTGTPGGKNVFLNTTGRWDARYLPAYVRRYPFVFAKTGQDQLTVCFDEACTALNEAEGEPLFEADGSPAPALTQAMALMTDYEGHAQLTQSFMERLEASGLLMDATANADLIDGRSMQLTGLWVVDETRLKDLPEVTLKEWCSSGELGLIYAHLLSLANLLEILRRQPAAQATEPVAAVEDDRDAPAPRKKHAKAATAK